MIKNVNSSGFLSSLSMYILRTLPVFCSVCYVNVNKQCVWVDIPNSFCSLLHPISVLLLYYMDQRVW